MPTLLSASATVSSSTSLPAACLLPSLYPGFIDLTITTAEEVVWRLYIQSELDILETEYPAGTNAPCTVNIIHYLHCQKMYSTILKNRRQYTPGIVGHILQTDLPLMSLTYLHQTSNYLLTI